MPEKGLRFKGESPVAMFRGGKVRTCILLNICTFFDRAVGTGLKFPIFEHSQGFFYLNFLGLKFFSSIFDLVWLFRYFLLFFHQKLTKNESIIKIKASNFGKDKVAQIVLSCMVISPKNSNKKNLVVQEISFFRACSHRPNPYTWVKKDALLASFFKL